jgi:hypothetical protein
MMLGIRPDRYVPSVKEKHQGGRQGGRCILCCRRKGKGRAFGECEKDSESKGRSGWADFGLYEMALMAVMYGS